MLFKVTAYFMLLVTAEDLILSIQEEEEKTLKFFFSRSPIQYPWQSSSVDKICCRASEGTR